MATANSLVFKAAGVVSYTDGTSGPFASVYDTGTAINPFALDSADNFDELYGDKSTDVNALKALLPGTITYGFGSSNRTKTVSDWWMELSGRVSYDDGTSGDWCVQYANGAQNDLGGDAHFSAALSVAGFLTAIQDALSVLASTTTVSA